MKIVHLNTYDGNGGAGRAALRLSNALKEQGIDSTLLCLYPFKTYPGVHKAYHNFFQKIKAIQNILLERFLVRFYLNNLDVPFSLQRFGFAIYQEKLLKEADIIHIHWINHGFLAPKQIKQLQKLNKKIVWTTHDSNPFTGGCHVRYNCNNYISFCGNCPRLKKSSSNDLSYRTWKKKQKAYQYLDINFIAPSNWMKKAVAVSSLVKQQVNMIPNGLEMDLFAPMNRQKCRKDLQIAPDKRIILAGYMPGKASKHKGFSELLQILQKLNKLPSQLLDSIEIIFFGSNKNDNLGDFPVKVHFVGVITDDEILVKYYNSADVFLMTSLEESMGYTALESLACGIPVVAFNTSGIRDVVIHKKTGYMANLYDIDEMINGILWVLKHENRVILSRNCRNYAKENYNQPLIAQKHINLYQSLLNKPPEK